MILIEKIQIILMNISKLLSNPLASYYLINHDVKELFFRFLFFQSLAFCFLFFSYTSNNMIALLYKQTKIFGDLFKS